MDDQNQNTKQEASQQEIEEAENLAAELRSMTMPEKLRHVKEYENGTLKHLILVDKKTKKPLCWTSKKEFEKWYAKRDY